MNETNQISQLSARAVLVVHSTHRQVRREETPMRQRQQQCLDKSSAKYAWETSRNDMIAGTEESECCDVAEKLGCLESEKIFGTPSPRSCCQRF